MTVRVVVLHSLSAFRADPHIISFDWLVLIAESCHHVTVLRCEVVVILQGAFQFLCRILLQAFFGYPELQQYLVDLQLSFPCCHYFPTSCFGGATMPKTMSAMFAALI